MQKQKRRIYFVIEENLSHLYMFALYMTSSQKNAERLIQIILDEIAKHSHDLTEYDDIRAKVFRLLFQIYSGNEDLNVNEYEEKQYESSEEFFLYKRLEEDHIYNQDEKLKLISNICENDLTDILANLPVKLRPYMLLRNICSFTYFQISYILDVPLDGVSLKLNQVNKIFQSEVWKKLAKNHQPSSSVPQL